MKRIIIALVLTASLSLFAQDQQSQKKQDSSVELPEFVITGKDIVTLRKANKIPPDFVSTLSEEFIKPAFPTESLPVKDFSTPVKGTITTLDSLNFVRGSLNLGMGSYYLPDAELNYSAPFQTGMFQAYGNAYNRRAYISNTEKYHINGGASLLLSVNDDAPFLPGTQIKFNGGLGTTSYRLYGSENPTFKRTYNVGSGYVKLDNLISRYFLFSSKFSDEFYYLSNENFSENMFNIDGFARLTLPNFNLGVDADFKRQALTNDSTSKSFTGFLALRPTVGFSVNKLMKVSLGFNYDNSVDQNFFSPYAAIALNLDKGISIYGDYSPRAEFYGGGYFLNQNPYFLAQRFSNIFMKKNTAFGTTVKFEYYTYFEIDAGFKYYGSDNLPYFTDKDSAGLFNLAETKATHFTGFINLLFHPGPGGVFYGTAELCDTRDTANNFVPYYPSVKVTLNYNYNFNIGLDAGASLTYLSGIYTDIQNTNKLSPYMNLGVKLGYRLHPNFYLTVKMSNILNRNNYLWNNYKEMPLDILVGLNYRW